MASTPYEPSTVSYGTTGVESDLDSSTDQSTADTAKEEAGRLKDTAAHTGSDLADTAKEQAGQVTSDVKDQAKQLAGEARDQLTDHAGSQMQRAAGTLRSLSDELSAMARHSEQSGMGAQLARQGGDLAGKAAGYLDARQPGDLVDDLRDFARRRPGTFLLGAAVAGVLVGRLTRGVHSANSNGSSDSGAVPATTAHSGSTPDWIESEPTAATTRLNPVPGPAAPTYADQSPPSGYAGGNGGVTP